MNFGVGKFCMITPNILHGSYSFGYFEYPSSKVKTDIIKKYHVGVREV
jgi:hypothetical protein